MPFPLHFYTLALKTKFILVGDKEVVINKSRTNNIVHNNTRLYIIINILEKVNFFFFMIHTIYNQ